MFAITIHCSREDKDTLIAELYDLGTEGIVEQDVPGGADLCAFFADLSTALSLADRFGSVVEEEKERDWAAEMRESWEPFAVGERFYLAPSWRDDPAPDGRLRIEIDPGRAFGTGRHETTQLCLEAMERAIRPGMAALDLGTGSGILAVAACLLGAAPVWACDIDAGAVEVARDNFRKAGAAADAFAGSVRSVRSSSVDVLIANINATALGRLAGDLARLLKPGGAAILSGFLWNELESIEALLVRSGLQSESAWQRGPWGCLLAIAVKSIGYCRLLGGPAARER